MKDYTIVLSKETLGRVEAYRQSVADGSEAAGALLRNQLRETDAAALDTEQFLECLLNTKQPQIFAESAVYGDGRDWSRSVLHRSRCLFCRRLYGVCRRKARKPHIRAA